MGVNLGVEGPLIKSHSTALSDFLMVTPFLLSRCGIVLSPCVADSPRMSPPIASTTHQTTHQRALKRKRARLALASPTHSLVVAERKLRVHGCEPCVRACQPVSSNARNGLPARKIAIVNVRHCRSLSPPVRPLAVTLAVQAVSSAAREAQFCGPVLRCAACRWATRARPAPPRTNRAPPADRSLRRRPERARHGRAWPAPRPEHAPLRTHDVLAMRSQSAHNVLCTWSAHRRGG